MCYPMMGMRPCVFVECSFFLFFVRLDFCRLLDTPTSQICWFLQYEFNIVMFSTNHNCSWILASNHEANTRTSCVCWALCFWICLFVWCVCFIKTYLFDCIRNIWWGSRFFRFFILFHLFCFFFAVALRVFPAETRLTVYRRCQVYATDVQNSKYLSNWTSESTFWHECGIRIIIPVTFI